MEPLSARDLLPLILKLPHEEQVRLAALALQAASSQGLDAEAYRHLPVAADEFASDQEPLSWEAEGWDEFNGTR